MSKFTATVAVTLKDSVLDPQGHTTLQALNALGFQDAQDLKIGKCFILTVNSANEAEAKKTVNQACEKLFVNPVIEKSTIIHFVKVG